MPKKTRITPDEFFNPPKRDPFPELHDQTAVFKYHPGTDFKCKPETLKSKLGDWARAHGVVVKATINDDGSVDASSRPLTEAEAKDRKKRADKARSKGTAKQAG